MPQSARAPRKGPRARATAENELLLLHLPVHCIFPGSNNEDAKDQDAVAQFFATLLTHEIHSIQAFNTTSKDTE